ncbi:hypothetical protein NicSoilB4_24860 [Arthrobacter sp. NicSoilB4]|nr:hypothetical protein NicSoilB4_24860 [Arthrobacter sp. NicSoilB4]
MFRSGATRAETDTIETVMAGAMASSAIPRARLAQATSAPGTNNKPIATTTSGTTDHHDKGILREL